MRNNNDMHKNSTYLRPGKHLNIIGSSRNSRRQLSANFRESPGTPEALIRALFPVVLLIAAGDQLQERCGSKSLTVFDKFMSWSLWGRPGTMHVRHVCFPPTFNNAHKGELESDRFTPNSSVI